VITQASQSNVHLPSGSNRPSRYDTTGLQRDNDDSDVEMASSTSRDRSVYEDAIVSAGCLQSSGRTAMGAGQT